MPVRRLQLLWYYYVAACSGMDGLLAAGSWQRAACRIGKMASGAYQFEVESLKLPDEASRRLISLAAKLTIAIPATSLPYDPDQLDETT